MEIIKQTEPASNFDQWKDVIKDDNGTYWVKFEEAKRKIRDEHIAFSFMLAFAAVSIMCNFYLANKVWP